ncbi:zinc finger domain-containing protein, partial [Goodea atripinnis]
VTSTETAQGTLCTPTKRPRESASGPESDATPEKRPRTEEKEGNSEEARGTPKQKNRRRCYRCQTKLELVQQELGSCRCAPRSPSCLTVLLVCLPGYVFCMLHRLPEQHDCEFDHLGRGREEAVLKMVKLDRKVGRSCQRIGEECS